MSITKQRIWSAFLALVLICSVVTVNPQPSHAASFSDVNGHWAKSYIDQAVEAGIVNGYEDGTFLPDKGVTRAEFTHMLNAALKNEGKATVSFTDTPNNEWYYADVQKAVAAGITSGYEDNTFRPQNTITRQEAAVFLANIVPTYGASGNLKTFPDYNDVADWAETALARINGKKYIGAYADDGKLHPKDHLTRAQATKIICDILTNESIVTSKTEVKTSGTSLSGKIYSNGVTLTSGLGIGTAGISNSVVLGTLTINGGGDSVMIQNSRIINVEVEADSDLRLIASGETNILDATVKSSATIETSSLASNTFGPGFTTLAMPNNNCKVVFTGDFPEIKMSGANSEATFTSGTVDSLTVSGKGSAVTVETSATLTNVTVDAAASFHGNGTIRNMNVNASNVTYAKEPVNLKIANNLKDEDDDDDNDKLDSDIAITPKYKATNVSRNTTIKLTFPSAITLYNGKTVTSSNIEDFVELRSKTSSGTKISYTAKIDSAKKVITITPEDELNDDTRYYVIIKKDSVMDDDGKGNDAFSSYFNTGGDSSSSYASFNPKNKETGVSVGSTLTITMSETVETIDGSSIKSSDLENYIIVLKKNSSTGSNVPFSATISSNKTIRIKPDNDLDPGTTYYLGIVKGEMRTKGDKVTIPAASVTFTTSGTSSSTTLSTPTLTVDTSQITARTTSKTAGTIYVVALPSTEKAPSASQVRNLRDYDNNDVKSTSNTMTVSANETVGIVVSNLKPNTSYKVYMVLEDKNKNLSDVVSATGTTSPTKITDIVIKPNTGSSVDLKYDEDGNPKPIWVDGKATSVTVTTKSLFGGTISPEKINLSSSGATTSNVTITNPGESKGNTYKLTIYKMAYATAISVSESKNGSWQTAVKIADNPDSGSSVSYKPSSEAEGLRFTVTLNDNKASYILYARIGSSSEYVKVGEATGGGNVFLRGEEFRDVKSIKIQTVSSRDSKNEPDEKDETEYIVTLN